MSTFQKKVQYRERYGTVRDAVNFDITRSKSLCSAVEVGYSLRMFDALNRGQLILPDGGWEGYTLVQRFEAGVLSRSGNLVSLIIRASPAGLSIDRIYISQGDPWRDPYDSVNPVVIRHTSAPLIIPPSSDPNESTRFALPAVSYALDHTRPLLIAVDFSATPTSEIMYKDASPREAVAYYKLQPPPTPTGEPEARKTNRTGYTLARDGIYLIERIEVG